MSRLLPFLMAGDPAPDALLQQLAQARAAGIDALEIGIPHSDPIADGPILQAAAQRAIARGVTLQTVLETLQGVTDSPDVVLFTYLNPLLQLGIEDLLRRLPNTPVRALLIVDLPFGEEPELEATLRAAGYPIVPLLTPTTSLERARVLLTERPDPGDTAPFAQRFAYVVARLGITGEGTTDLAPVRERITALQAITTRPLAVGFGLGDAGTLRQVRAMGATPIVGSALVERMQSGESMAEVMRELLADT